MIDEDVYELEQDANHSQHRTPQQIMEEKYYEHYRGNWKLYLQSIEWDDWCKPYDPIESMRLIEEHERKIHPFNKFF